MRNIYALSGLFCYLCKWIFFAYNIHLLHLHWITLTIAIMVTSCVAYGCTNQMKKGGNISFHRFPHSKPELLQKWVQAIRRKPVLQVKTILFAVSILMILALLSRVTRTLVLRGLLLEFKF